MHVFDKDYMEMHEVCVACLYSGSRIRDLIVSMSNFDLINAYFMSSYFHDLVLMSL